MDWLTRMKDALDYIEDHMEEPVSISDIAKTACSSTFHFQRMFHMLTGMTVAEYIRKRRLTLAAQELAVSSTKVLDTALKYGYDSPESFAKAFRKIHGIAPSQARDPGVKLEAFPRISFHLSLKGDQDMDYRIVEKDGFTVVGKSIQVSLKDGDNFKQIPAFWAESDTDGTSEALLELGSGGEMLGICTEMQQGQEQFTYIIAVESNQEAPASSGFITYEVPAATWAVFPVTGAMPDAMQDIWKRIFQEWFPATGYEHADAPEFELYSPGDPAAADYRSEVWIPVLKK
ncbi:AraC family transcriptional regulator [Paenibacillus sp. P96]|uniref:AraC family transcriptional regulator n=1 Tax=Paenibacillus zeirhizosphaerae TaxID=2987519 RepID=A0ABT9FNK6_9BACL|nr:AraC family transcriptional regulator [Paenibacillus sp. P96]MDP4096319.1 AraC family transcriptional regulator [Paenibacillus sp. P96]